MQFEPGSVHTATATFKNPKSAGFDYEASLCMGAGWTEMATASFHLDAGQSKGVRFSVTMPTTLGTYPVYFKVSCGGVLIGTFVATEDVIIAPVGVPKFVYASNVRLTYLRPLDGVRAYLLEVDIQNVGNAAGLCFSWVYRRLVDPIDGSMSSRNGYFGGNLSLAPGEIKTLSGEVKWQPRYGNRYEVEGDAGWICSEIIW